MADVLTYHVDASRSGLITAFPFPPSGGSWRKYATLAINSPIRASPLFVKGYAFTTGPLAGKTHDLVIIAASDNTVHAYAEDELLNGILDPLWVQETIGPASLRPGSNIPPPIGICGTPVIDRNAKTIYLIAYIAREVPLAPSGVAGITEDIFYIVALNLDTGAIKSSVPLVDPKAPANGYFDSQAHDNRTGLNLVNGWIYATFAAFQGNDKGNYKGWVVAVKQSNLSQQLFLPVVSPNTTGGGIWGPGGVAAAENGIVYASTGNSPSAYANSDAYWMMLGSKRPGDPEVGDYFEGVVACELNDRNSTLTVAAYYQPAWTKYLNDEDLDFGGSSPMVLPAVGSTQYVVTTAKDGNVYLLGPDLAGWGTELWSSATDHVNPTNNALFGTWTKGAPARYQAPTGEHYIYVVGRGTPGLVAFTLDTHAAKPSLKKVWGAGTNFSAASASPFVTVEAPGGQGQALVWMADSTETPVLQAFDALTGKLVFSSAKGEIDQCPHFIPLTAAGNSIFVGTNKGVVAFTRAPPKLRTDRPPPLGSEAAAAPPPGPPVKD